MTAIMMRLALVCAVLVQGASVFAQARRNQGFVKVRPDRELFVDYIQPQNGQPTVILMNGLTYSTKQFDAYTSALIRRGLGVLRFDFDGMGQTLLKYAPSTKVIPYDQQARDAKALFTAMGLRPPYSIMGLSYGGGIAIAYSLMYPRDIRHLILFAPFTQPLEGQDSWIKGQIWATRKMFPFNPASDDELYDYFLHQIVYATYPQAEPVVLENPYKLEGVYNIVRGIRKFRAVDSAGMLPNGTVHMVVAGYDQYIPRPVLETFWSKVNPSAKMSYMVLQGSEHKMPEAFPEFSAAWTYQILKGNPALYQGQSFDGYPLTMSATSNKQRILLNE